MQAHSLGLGVVAALAALVPLRASQLPVRLKSYRQVTSQWTLTAPRSPSPTPCRRKPGSRLGPVYPSHWQQLQVLPVVWHLQRLRETTGDCRRCQHRHPGPGRTTETRLALHHPPDVRLRLPRGPRAWGAGAVPDSLRCCSRCQPRPCIQAPAACWVQVPATLTPSRLVPSRGPSLVLAGVSLVSAPQCRVHGERAWRVV